VAIASLLKKRILFFTSVIVILLAMVNSLFALLFMPGDLTEHKEIIIKQKLSIHEMSHLLSTEGVISNRYFFEIIAKLYSLRRPLKSGEYEFTKGISMYQVLAKLASGISVVHKLVIIEGQSVSEIISKINNEDRLLGQINTSIPEGYLMPSTYFYSYGDLKEKIIDEMRNNMSKALDEAMKKLAPDSPIKTRKDVLILASIVEKEAGNNKEKPLIAGVFINRLNKGMRLQADPTIIYAITMGKTKMPRLLSRKDLEIDSPYNTYKISGLPPGAIACPGKLSIEAVASPAKTNALYFVVSGKGGHNFSSTLDEHNQNVKKYRDQNKSN
jgi:UPF0755 protein